MSDKGSAGTNATGDRTKDDLWPDTPSEEELIWIESPQPRQTNRTSGGAQAVQVGSVQAVPIAAPVFLPTSNVLPSPTMFGRFPFQMLCPHCGATVITAVQRKAGWGVFYFCILLIVIGCCIVAWVPLMIDELHDFMHYCPSCGQFLGYSMNRL